MVALLKIIDEHFGTKAAERRPAVELRLASERVTVRDIIRQRVEAEVEEANQKKLSHAIGHARTRSFLIDFESSSPEGKLNLPIIGRKKPKMFDAVEETDRAIKAFEKRQFIMLFDDRQIDDLDAGITLMPESEAVFLYLTPLKGG